MSELLQVRILLVEDDPEDVRIFRRHAAVCGDYHVSVEHAPTCGEAESLLASHAYDVVFLDLKLAGGETALGLLDRVKGAWPDLPVVILTGLDTVRHAVETIKAGASDYLLKDSFGPDVLQHAIRYACEEHRLQAERRKAEEALRRSEGRFRSLFEGIPEAVLVHDQNGLILHINAVGARRLEWSVEELVGRPLHDVVAPDYAGMIGQRAQTTLAEGDYSFYTVYVSRSGRRIEAEVNESLIEFEGKPAILSVSRDVTERERMIRALRQSERRFRSILESVRDVAYRLDLRRQTFSYVSPSVEDLLGHTPAELIALGSQGVLDLIHPDDARRFGDLTRRLLTGRDAEEPEPALEYRLRHKDGRYVWASDKRRLVRDERSRPAALVGTVRDITELKRAELALSRQQDDLPPATPRVFRKDKDLRFVWINDAAAEALGVTQEEAVGKTDADFWPERAARLAAEDREVLRHGRTQVRIFAEEDPDGREIHWREVRVPMPGPDGQPSGLLLVKTDITAQQRAGSVFAQWATVVAASRDAIIGLARDGTVLNWSPGAERTYGYTLEEVRGQPAAMLSLPDHRQEFRQAIARTAQGVGTEDQRTVHGHKDGRPIDVAFSMSPVISADGEVAAISLIARDISGRRRAEEERRRLEERIRQAQKLESLGVLAGGIAHDFNNLLTGVLGNAGLALLELPPDSPARYSIERIEEAARHAAELANQMLAYSGKGRFVMEELDLSEMIRQMSHLLEAAVSRHINLSFDLAPGLCTMVADPSQAKQVIMNLVTNAGEAIGSEPGTIRVVTRTLEPGPDYFVDAYIQGDTTAPVYACLQVTDTGCGMDAKTQAQMFEPFFSTKFTGRGLGLAAVLGIVRGHLGTVKVRSQVGRGTTFEILFPARPRPARSAPGAGEPGRDRQAAGGAVLVVDDEETVRTVASRMLERFGYRAVTAEGGEEAVRLFGARSGEIVAVILDMTMPGLGGYETFRRLMGIRSDVPVIVSSGYSEDEAARQFGDRGPAGFIQKPYTPDRLRSVVAAAIAGAR